MMHVVFCTVLSINYWLNVLSVSIHFNCITLLGSPTYQLEGLTDCW